MLKNFSIIKAMIFLVVMYRCDNWTIKNGEWWRIDGFELWSWTRLLRVHWTKRRPNQSMLKEINHEYLLEGQMLKLKLQYFGQLMWRTYSLENTLFLGKIEGRRRRGRQRMSGWMASLTRYTWVWTISRSWWRTGRPGMLQSMGFQRVGHDWATELNWTYPIANAICNWSVSPARLGLPKAPTYIPNQSCTQAQKSVPSIHKAFSEFWLQGDLHFSWHKEIKETFILLSQATPK